jgi:hypothetical protein
MRDETLDRFGDPVTVKFVDGIEGHNLGAWDERTGTIYIDKNQPKAGQCVVLVHELLHMSETMLRQVGIVKNEIDHEYITNAAPLILAALVDMGLFSGIGPDDLTEWLEAEAAKIRLEGAQ